MDANRTVAFFCSESTGHVNPILGVADAMTKQGWEVHFYVPQVCKQLVEGVGAKWQPMGHDDLTIEDAAVDAITNKLGMDMTADIHVNVLPFRVVPATLTVPPYLLKSVSRLSPRFVVFDACAPWGLILSQVLRVSVVSCMPALSTPAAERDNSFGRHERCPQSRVPGGFQSQSLLPALCTVQHDHFFPLLASCS
ncbi:unnamed protein product [Prorocentrum cordatum]|uniref:Monogalactosyldiacylglycerol synthase n=1 Tax=Prorocentrum cordatum TaxID=2364126 RepID=A0ABN9PPE4_9DINO|nr:unnamed protein product [Polarella glacialis]CAK0835945.1 unnamed protein product [Polarella glacialis]